MSERKRGNSLVRYFCTAGNGMEQFLVEEVKKKLDAEDVSQLQGKVVFSSSVSSEALRHLKAAERLFLLLREGPPVTLPQHIGQAKAAAMLQSQVLGQKSQWINAAMTWGRLQRALSGRSKRTREEENERDEEEKWDGASRKSRREQCVAERQAEEEEGETELLAGNGAQMPEKRRKGDSEEFTDGETREKEGRKRQKNGDDIDHVCGRGPDRSCDDEDGEPPPDAPSLSFRINCKSSGALSRRLSSQELSCLIGGGLSSLTGWRVNLKNPEMEVSVSLSDDHCMMGIPLTRLPLANRTYIRTTGLRATVAWAMTSLAQIQPGFCVVDPMCGVGTILLEAAEEHKEACFWGVDIDDGQLQKANENVAFAGHRSMITLLKASALALPLPSSFVDAVISDLPFGRKFGSKPSMADNLPIILTEMERILRVGGALVLLLSPQLSCLLKKLQTQQGGVTVEGAEPDAGACHTARPACSSLKHQATYRVSLGAIDGLIHKYIKEKIVYIA